MIISEPIIDFQLMSTNDRFVFSLEGNMAGPFLIKDAHRVMAFLEGEEFDEIDLMNLKKRGRYK